MKYAELLRELHSLKGSTLISFHSLGDVEAIASAVALSHLLKNVKVVVKSPDKPNSTARHLLQKLEIPTIPALVENEVKKFDNVVLVDVANSQMLGKEGSEFAKFKGKLIAIDHHEHGKLLKNGHVFEFPHRTSCCEVIYDLYRVSGKKISPEIATLLLCGVITDTANFKTANRETFQAVAQLLLASDKKYEELLQLVKTIPDASEVKQIFNALQGTELIETQIGIVGVARASCFEAKIALTLVEIGCVVGVCVDVKNGKIAMVKDNENVTVDAINVGELMKFAGREMNGSGGGHESVGGCSGKKELTEKALEKLVERVEKNLAN
ncbi:MAG: DHH family phosphoesterase [Candidatus Micrarchaeota archaeon]